MSREGDNPRDAQIGDGSRTAIGETGGTRDLLEVWPAGKKLRGELEKLLGGLYGAKYHIEHGFRGARKQEASCGAVKAGSATLEASRWGWWGAFLSQSAKDCVHAGTKPVRMTEGALHSENSLWADSTAAA